MARTDIVSRLVDVRQKLEKHRTRVENSALLFPNYKAEDVVTMYGESIASDICDSLLRDMDVENRMVDYGLTFNQAYYEVYSGIKRE